MAFSNLTADMNIVGALADKPNEPPDSYSAAALKAKFDEGPSKIKQYINEVHLLELASSGAAANIGADSTDTGLNFSNVQEAVSALADKSSSDAAEAKEYADTLKAQVDASLVGVKNDLESDISDTRTSLQSQINETESGLSTYIADVRNEVIHMVSTPLTATTATAMTDTSRIYVYTGNTYGSYTYGHWYYWNGATWVDGGSYNTAVINTDTALSASGAAADAKITGGIIAVKDLVAYASTANETYAGVEYTYAGDNTWIIDGTPTGTSFHEIFLLRDSIAPFANGKQYYFLFECDSSEIALQIYKYVGSTLSHVTNIFGGQDQLQLFTFPSDATGVIVRFKPFSAVTSVRCKVNIIESSQLMSVIRETQAAAEAGLRYKKVLTSQDDMDDFGESGTFCYLGSSKPANAPNDASNAVVTVIHGYDSQGFCTQYVSTLTGKMFQRFQITSGDWTNWVDVTAGTSSGGGDIIQNTYNITTEPQITTDSNGWLQAVDIDTVAEAGKTDMTGPIMSMLTETGYCHLGEGIFYVSGNIDMPDGSFLCGCGEKTVIRLLQSTTSGYCIKIKDHCTIENLSLSGARSGGAPGTMGTRHGILFAANSDGTEGETVTTTTHCKINSVWIRRFSGSGIKCHNTSANYAEGLSVENCFIYGCYAGINIDYKSEFNKFSDCVIAWCDTACVNNGGNNVFIGCTFHATSIGVYVDGTQPNSGHGTIDGCTFCHIGSNAGSAITMDSVANGFIISASQFWYNSIDASACSGIVFSGCEFGRGTTGYGATINISGGNTVLFSGCMFMNDTQYPPQITITQNSKVKFTNCYGSASGNAIAA